MPDRRELVGVPPPLAEVWATYGRLQERLQGESGPLADALREVTRLAQNGEVYYSPPVDWSARETRLRDAANFREALTNALLTAEPPLASAEAQAVKDAVEAASALRHPERAMAVTLECGHLRLMRRIDCVQGVGAYTTCRVCPPEEQQPSGTRLVCKVEETGVLHPDWRNPVTKAATGG